MTSVLRLCNFNEAHICERSLLPNSFLKNGSKPLLYLTENSFKSSLNYSYIAYARLRDFSGFLFIFFLFHILNILSLKT